MTRYTTRRRFVLAAGALATTPLAGCTDSEGTDGGGSGDTNDGSDGGGSEDMDANATESGDMDGDMDANATESGDGDR